MIMTTVLYLLITVSVSLLRFFVKYPDTHHAEHLSTLRERLQSQPLKILRALSALYDDRDGLRQRLVGAVEKIEREASGGKREQEDIVFSDLTPASQTETETGRDDLTERMKRERDSRGCVSTK